MSKTPKQLPEGDLTDHQADVVWATVKTDPERFGAEGMKARRKWGRYAAKPGIAPVAVTEMILNVGMCDKFIDYAQKVLDHPENYDEKTVLRNQKLMLECIELRTKIIKDTFKIGEHVKDVKAAKAQNAPPNFAVQVNVGDKKDGEKPQTVEVIQRGNGALLPGKAG